MKPTVSVPDDFTDRLAARSEADIDELRTLKEAIDEALWEVEDCRRTLSSPPGSPRAARVKDAYRDSLEEIETVFKRANVAVKREAYRRWLAARLDEIDDLIERARRLDESDPETREILDDLTDQREQILAKLPDGTLGGSK